MLKIEQLFYSIQVRNHLKLLTDSNLFPNLTKEKLREIKETIRKIDNLFLDSSITALKELEESTNSIQKVIVAPKENIDIVSESLQNLPQILTSQIGEQKIIVPALSNQELWQKAKELKEVSTINPEKVLVNETEKSEPKNVTSSEVKQMNLVETTKKSTEEKNKKRTSKPKTKEEVTEVEGKLESVTLADVNLPKTLSEVQKTGKRAIFRRRS